MNVKRFDYCMICMLSVFMFLMGMVGGQLQKKQEVKIALSNLSCSAALTDNWLNISADLLRELQGTHVELELSNTRNDIHKRQNANLLIEIDGLRTLINKNPKLRKYISLRRDDEKIKR